jgi:hypothetical protein
MTVIIDTTKNRSKTKCEESIKKNRRCDVVLFCISIEYKPKREKKKQSHNVRYNINNQEQLDVMLNMF